MDDSQPQSCQEDPHVDENMEDVNGSEKSSGLQEDSEQPIPEPSEQKNKIKALWDKELKKGETWFLICAKWLSSWKEYVEFDRERSPHEIPAAKPDAIDNTTFLDENGNLDFDIVQGLNFHIIPSEVWRALVGWYGGGPEAARTVISRGGLIVDLKPLYLKLIESKNKNEITGRWSETEKVGTLFQDGCKLLSLDPQSVRIYDYHRRQKIKLLTSMEATLLDERIYDNQEILFEIKNADGTWPSTEYTRTGNSWSTYNSYNSSPAGLVGLCNLGNTCFMNSALQCLAHTMCLKPYFVEGRFQTELNRNNPLGLRGELADAYADLLKQLWTDNPPVAPREFKRRLGQFAPQFEGFQQHDSQELLAYLLDGLHEDLNRITQKPYVEVKDYDGRPDEIIAQESWQNHKRRNDSIIVDYFQAQLKSTLQCPNCSKISITFDPFLYLSLPLPLKTHRTFSVTMVFRNPQKKAQSFSVSVIKRGSILDLKKELSIVSNVHEDWIQIAEVSQSRIIRLYSDINTLEYITSEKFYAYEIEPRTLSSDEQAVRVYQRDPKTKSTCGDPILINLPDHISYKDLSRLLFIQLQQFIKNFDEHLDEIENPNSDSVQMHDIPSETDVDPDYDPNDPDADHQSHRSRDVSPPKTPYSRFFSLRDQDHSDYAYARWCKDENPVFSLTYNPVISVTWTSWAFDNVYQAIDRPAMMSENTETLTLGRSIDLFTKEEILGPQDPWYCNRCKDFVQASKKFDIWSLPNILVIHLKRFYFRGTIRCKLESQVEFPVEGLDMSPYVKSCPDKPLIYDLFAVSNHSGGLGAGHYTAYGKHTNGNWYKFDDSHVSQVSASSIITPNAYLLFYQLRESNERGSSFTSPRAESTTTQFQNMSVN